MALRFKELKMRRAGKHIPGTSYDRSPVAGAMTSFSAISLELVDC
jgi:hypothetical protein